MDKKLVKKSFLLAGGEVLYILLVAAFFGAAERFLSDQPDNFLSPVVFLLLLVISAAVSGALVFGKPVLFYLEGKKKESFALFASILGWLFLFFATALVISLFV